jgi:hypothetical protein
VFTNLLDLFRMQLIAACLVVAGLPVISHASALSDAANSMQPGTFAQVTGMNGWNAGAILSPGGGCTTSDYITQFADKAAWDPVGQHVYFVGQTHGSCYGGEFVEYTDSNSTWSVGPWPSGICQSGTPSSPCFSHAYGHNTVDPTTGDFYYRQYNSVKFFRFRNGSWSTLPAPSPQSSQCCGALEYFKDMNRLLFLDGDWGLWAFNPSTNAWTQLANTHVANAAPGLPNLDMSSYNNFAVYDPVQKLVLFGGGTNVYAISANGTITTKKAAPVSLGTTQGVVSVDPVGGKYLVLSGSSMYQYDPSADSWTKLAITLPPVFTSLDGVGDGLVAADVTTYGAIMYIKYDMGSSAVYLYKHSPSAPVAPPPAPPPAAVKPEPPTNVTVQ